MNSGWSLSWKRRTVVAAVSGLLLAGSLARPCGAVGVAPGACAREATMPCCVMPERTSDETLRRPSCCEPGPAGTPAVSAGGAVDRVASHVLRIPAPGVRGVEVLLASSLLASRARFAAAPGFGATDGSPPLGPLSAGSLLRV